MKVLSTLAAAAMLVIGPAAISSCSSAAYAQEDGIQCCKTCKAGKGVRG